MPIRTTVIGAWWPQEQYAEDLERLHCGVTEPGDGERILSDAAAAAIAQQRELGLSEWTGGEYFAYNFIAHTHRRLAGIEVEREEADYIVDYDDVAQCVITGELEAPAGMGYVEAYRRESGQPGGVTKATMVGPFELVAGAVRQADAVAQQMPNLIKIVNMEILGLEDAGCPLVQLDIPSIGVLINSGAMTPEAGAEIVADCFAGVKTRRGIHICNGSNRGKPMSGDIRNTRWLEMLKHLDGVVDVAAFECSYFAQYQEREAFRRLPATMELAAGIVSEQSYAIEPVAKIKQRIEDWAQVVGEERLWISTNCGFAGHPLRNVPVLRQKVENMVEAAASV